MIRVLALTHNYPRREGDPVGSFVLRLAVALRQRDVDVHVLAPASPDAPEFEVMEGIPVTRFHYAPRRWETITYTGTMGAQVQDSWTAKVAMLGLLGASYRNAVRLIREWKPDVIHAHWWFPAGLVARGLHARTNTPYVVTMHGSDLRLAANTRGWGAATLFRMVSRRAAAMTTVSSWLADESRKLDPACTPIVAPMPVVTDLFHPGKSRDANRILFVGKLTEQKGLHHLLRAMTLMTTRASLDVVGAGRVDDSAVKGLADELAVSDRITWYPLLPQTELSVLYRSASVHVVPAIGEGLGLTAVESLLSETPVVAFDSGGLPDVVIPEKTGILVPPGDTAALAYAIDRILGDETYRARLGSGGREFALSRFGSDAVAAQYAAVLRVASGQGDSQ